MLARSQVGIREKGGHNRGPEVERYLRSVGLGPGFSWCAAFVYWCFAQSAKQCKVRNPCPRTGHALTLFTHAPAFALIRLSDPDYQERIRPGCIFVQDHDWTSSEPFAAHRGHCGIIEGVDFSIGEYSSIDGNTDPTGGRDGDGVYPRNRPLVDSKLVGFIDLGAPKPPALVA